MLCSQDEDPTAKVAKKRSIEISASRVAQKIEKYINALDSELRLLETVSMDTAVANKLHEQSKRLNDMSSKLANFQGLGSPAVIPEKDSWQQEPLPLLHAVNELPGSPAIAPYGNGVTFAIDSATNIIHQVVHVLRLIPEAQARIRFTYFLHHMLPYFPLISLPESFQNYDYISNNCPQLLLVCIYVTTFDHHGFCSEEENVKLNKSLQEIVDTLLTRNVFLNTTDFSYRHIFTCIVVSLWSVPPPESGEYKTHMEILAAANVALCIDAGNAQLFPQEAIFNDDSLERNDLRGFLCLYTSLANMGFSLPRFNLIPWSKRQDLAVEKLLRVNKNLPSRGDEYLCLQARLVRIGQELLFQFSINGIGLQFLSSNEKAGESMLPTEFFGEFKSMEYENANDIIELFQERLFGVLKETGNIDLNSLTALEGAPKQTYWILQLYFQILIAAHDNLVSWSFCRLSGGTTSHSVAVGEHLYKHINGFSDSCKRLIRGFIEIQKEVVSLPTPYHYRAALALISLLRILVLVKSDFVAVMLKDYPPIDFELVSLHAQVSEIFEKNSKTLKLTICNRIGGMLIRISNWINEIQNRDNSDANNPDAKDEFFKLSQMSKGQELWRLNEPSVQVNRARPWVENVPNISKVKAPPSSDTLNGAGLGYEEEPDKGRDTFISSIHEIFKDVDDDYVRFFNPLEPME